MPTPLFVADVGNSTIQIGEFFDVMAPVPQPERTFGVSVEDLTEDIVASWIGEAKDVPWHIGSVNEDTCQSLESHLTALGVSRIHRITNRDVDLRCNVLAPQKVGIDRLTAAFAANVLRSPQSAAIVVDSGTATTIDVVSSDGAFLGGLILPGMELSLKALHLYTDQLPKVDIPTEPPSLIGNDTRSAMEAGVFWLTAAGIDGLLAKLQGELPATAEIFVTGGKMASTHRQLSHDVRHIPFLVLSGLAMVHR